MLAGPGSVNRLTEKVIGAALKVHRRLGPGLLEHAYTTCLRYELEKLKLHTVAEIPVDLQYDQMLVEGAYRIDLLVEDLLVIEIKAVEKVLPVHHAQVLTYLKLTGKQIGLLFNFNSVRLTDGLKRFVCGLETPSEISENDPRSPRGAVGQSVLESPTG
jgi:GxxExxY protein